MLIESFIQGKTGSLELCEDKLLITEHFIAVIDGVTSKSEFMLDNKTTGQWAAELAGRCISGFEPEIDSLQAIERLTRSFKQFYIDHGRVELAASQVSERLAACVVIYSRLRHEIWMAGDCQCLVDGEQYYRSFKRVDEIASEARALYVAAELLEGKTVEQLLDRDTSREYVLPLIKMGATFQNCPERHEYSYAVIDGFEVKPERILVIRLGPDVREVVLASDGYPKLLKSLIESELYLQKVLDEDPLCYSEYKSTKGLARGNQSFDDRTYVRFAIHNIAPSRFIQS